MVTKTEIRLQEILNEDDLRDKVSKYSLNKPAIKSTSSIAGSKNFTTDKTLKVFRKSKLIIFLVLILIGMMLFAVFFSLLKQKEINQGGLAVGLICIFIFILNFLRQFFYDDNLNFTIYIDNEGIQIDETLFNWNQIKETAILNYPGKGGGTNKLIILLQDDTYWKYDLTNFYSFEGIAKTISNYIEFFKPKLPTT
ncbi:MAG: hypothetical protein ACJ751_21480 [Niastella sp.]|jgi:hypothetical protein|uniref:hypothetical protein n=1 Tax=Niastella sp. TaxID=1869183 RepID=UPI00389A4E7C